MRPSSWMLLLFLTACQATPRGLALCSRVPRYQALTASDLAVHSVCVDTSAMANFTGSAQVMQVLGDAGLQVAIDAPCEWRLVLTSAAPATLGDPATAVWNTGAASQERFAVVSAGSTSPALSTIYASSDRGAVYGVRAAIASLIPSPEDAQRRLFQSGEIVDYPSFPLRGVVESIYGKTFSVPERYETLNLMGCFAQNLYIYGQKDRDPYTHAQWADPYPEVEAAGIQSAARTAHDNLISFVWALSPGWWGGDAYIKDSICYSCDADFARLKSKTAAMRALGITRFALLLDDLAPSLPWPADQMKFSTLAQAHAFLINRWDDYLIATGASEHLLVVGDKYTSDSSNQVSGFGWEPYNRELGAAVRPGVQLMWTGTQVYSPTLAASDLTGVDSVLGQPVIVWDNWPKNVAALSGRSADLPSAASGFVSCPVLNQHNAHPVADFWPVLGTAADYAWRTDTYVPEDSLARWQRLLPSLIP